MLPLFGSALEVDDGYLSLTKGYTKTTPNFRLPETETPFLTANTPCISKKNQLVIHIQDFQHQVSTVQSARDNDGVSGTFPVSDRINQMRVKKINAM